MPKAIEIPIVAVGGTGGAAASVGVLKEETDAATLSSERLGEASVATSAALDKESVAARTAGVANQRLTGSEIAAAAAARRAAAIRSEATKGLIAQSASAVGLRGAIIGANPAFLAATAGAIAFGKSIQSIKNFETELNVFQETAGVTADQMEKVRATAEALGKDITLPAVGAQDAAEAMTELAKAGLSVQDSIEGARGVLQLATAANIDNAQATELAASALNAFGLAGDQAVHVADVLANAANDSQGSIVDIGIALRQAAAVGRQAGLSFEQVAGFLTILARNGLVGSDAGTAFRTMLIRLINPTDKAAKLIRDLGLNLRTATGAIDLTVFDQFSRATENLTKRQRDQAQAIIFGQDAIRAAAIGTREGSAAIDAQTRALEKSGTAALVAGARTRGLAGDFENAKNQAAALGLELGDLASGPVGVFFRGIANTFASVDKALENVRFGFSSVFGGDTFNEADKNFTQLADRIDEIQGKKGFLKSGIASLGVFGGSAGLAGQDAEDLRESIDALGASAAEMVRQGFLNEVLKRFIQLSPLVKKALEDGIITPVEEAELAADGLGRAFLAAVPHTADLFQSFGLVAQGSIEAARSTIDRAGPTLAEAMAEAIHDGTRQATGPAQVDGATLGDSLAKSIAAGIATAQDAISAAFSGLARGARLDIGRLQSELLDVQFRGGNDAAQRAILVRERKRQEDLIDTLVGKGATRAKIDAAKKDAIDTQNKIDAIDEAATAAAERAANKREQDAKKIQQARAKADQEFLDALGAGRRPLELKITRAEGTERVTDDLKRQQQLRTRILAEIDAISKRDFEDAKDKATAIATRRQELAGVVNTIRSERAAQNEQIAQLAEDKFNLRVSIAQASGNSQLLIKLFDQQIHDTQVAISKADQNSKLQLELKEKLAQVRQDREAAVSGLEEKRIQIAELRGNKSAELELINARIERLKKAIAAAKRQHKATIDLQLELAQTEKDRKDLLDEAEDANKKATTAFDLLKQAADTFNQSAGNLINQQQPFAGPTGFTADIAQFLIRRQQPTAAPARGTVQVPPVQLQDQPLIQAIEKLTGAILGASGNASTAGGTPSARTARQWHSENMLARQFQEG